MKFKSLGSAFSLLIFFSGVLCASEPRINLPVNAFDGGVLSAETLGRGGSFASGAGTPGSAGENPASLETYIPESFYLTTYLGMTTDIEESSVSARHPLEDRVLQYMAVHGDKGVLFYEPLGRIDRTDVANPANPTIDLDQTEFAADAIGFAGAHQIRGGSFGLSISYLRASFSQVQQRAGMPDRVLSDRADGFRLNFGLRYPTGPVMWGISLRNAPAFLFWKDHKRSLLPFTVRVGNAWRVRPGTIFSVDAEKRYYNEGGQEEETLYFGWEQFLKENITYRLGVFSDEMDNPDERHYTGGLSIKTSTGLILSYAAERFEMGNEKVVKSILSMTLPFQRTTSNENSAFSSQ